MGYNQLIWDQKKHEFNWVGKKIEHDITWCYLEIEDINMFYKGIITNFIFVADYQDQLNITHFIKGNKWKCSCIIKIKSQVQFSLMKEIVNDDIIRVLNH